MMQQHPEEMDELVESPNPNRLDYEKEREHSGLEALKSRPESFSPMNDENRIGVDYFLLIGPTNFKSGKSAINKGI